MIISRSMFPLQTNFSQIMKMQNRLGMLQVQLATGQKATSLADMGDTRPTSLNLRSQINTLGGYAQSISTVNLRLTTMNNTLERFDEIEADSRIGSVPGGYGTGNINLSTGPTIAKNRLDEVLTLANGDINGRYIFGGSITDKKPVATLSEVLDGIGGKFGFKKIAEQRLAADQGTPDGDGKTTGRLLNTISGTAVSLQEDGDHPFGMKLSTLTRSGSGAPTLTEPVTTDPQASLTVDFAAQPLDGETVTMGFTMPDGTEETITLKAVTDTPGKGEYQIGATEADTAANFFAAMTTSVQTMSGGTMAAASNYAAADNFFNGEGEAVMRVDGPPYDTATGLVAATDAETVLWYRGGEGDTARQSVTAKIDENTTVAYGVQANEEGIVELVKSLAVMAISSFQDSDTTSEARFDAVASRQITRLSEGNNTKPGSLETIAVELGMAQATVQATQDRQGTYQVQLDNLLADIEQVTPEQVAMELLAVKTRLEASYNVTSMVSQLSLVNFMR